MKKLLASGMERIYQLGPCFRDGERGSRHNPEFTMLEWYRRNATYLDIKDDFTQLLDVLGLTAKAGDMATITVRQAYMRFASWDPFEGSWDQDRFDYDMAVKVEPALKNLRGVFLIDYPKQCASLAKVVGSKAERWEFYFQGLELANCFTELCDGEEQRRRFAAAKEERKALGEADYPLDEEFLACVDAMHSAAGVAVGIDRLVMAALGLKDIDQARVI